MKPGIIWIFLGIVIIMGAIAFVLFQSKTHAPAQTACSLEAKTCPDGTVVGRVGPSCEFAACPTGEGADATFSWRFEDAAPLDRDGVSVPRTQVFLTFNGQKELHMGTYDGTCTAIAESTWGMLEDEQDGAICWYAGSGVEIGVFLEGEYNVVKRGILEEGSEEAGGLRGNLVSIYTLR